MRLITRTTLYFFTAMALIICATGFYLYNQFNRQINERSDNELLGEEAGWIEYLENGVPYGAAYVLSTRDISIAPTRESATALPVITDVNVGNIPNRQLIHVVEASRIRYKIAIRKSQAQKTVLINGFTRILLLVLVGLFIVSIIFNWVISRWLWTPFNRSLQKIRTANLQQLQQLSFEHTNTSEFNELNASLNEMTAKIHRDYISMKEFTENAAHEMQTPIAVVQGKLELLLQDGNLDVAQLQSIEAATDSLNRLAKLNQGLLMLAKIENRQFNAIQQVNITTITRKYLELFNDLIKDKQLQLTTNFSEDFIVPLHPSLADSLISNLVGNAIKYNYPNGIINIDIGKTGFQIRNSSHQPEIATELLWQRFRGSDLESSESNGLGLAIVKKIAENNGLLVNYRFCNGQHIFEIDRNTTNK